MKIEFSHIKIEKTTFNTHYSYNFCFEIDEEERIYFRLSEDCNFIGFNYLNSINYLSHLLLEVQIQKKYLKEVMKKERKKKLEELKKELKGGNN